MIIPPALALAVRDLAAPLDAALAARGEAPIGINVLTERAALLGLGAPGRTSANGSCRLIRAADGWIALNLARPDDLDLLPALIGQADIAEPWQAVTAWAADKPVAAIREAALLLGLPLAVAGEATDLPAVSTERLSAAAPPPDRPLVVDLSSLWAGPLCGAILARLGCDVVKVESLARPDRTREASTAFDARLNGGKTLRRLDFRLGDLPDLLARADIVIEASRPRALRQLGIEAEAVVRNKPSMIWASITAYGRHGDAGRRVGFGDDAAVAGGLMDWQGDGPRFLGDAIADPIAGLTAAAAIQAARATGGGVLIDVAMAGAAAAIAQRCHPHLTSPLKGGGTWLCVSRGASPPLRGGGAEREKRPAGSRSPRGAGCEAAAGWGDPAGRNARR